MWEKPAEYGVTRRVMGGSEGKEDNEGEKRKKPAEYGGRKEVVGARKKEGNESEMQHQPAEYGEVGIRGECVAVRKFRGKVGTGIGACGFREGLGRKFEAVLLGR